MSMIRGAINGFGRIGCNTLRALYESSFRNRMLDNSLALNQAEESNYEA